MKDGEIYSFKSDKQKTLQLNNQRLLYILLTIKDVVLNDIIVYHGARMLRAKRLREQLIFLETKFVANHPKRILSPTKPTFIILMRLGV